MEDHKTRRMGRCLCVAALLLAAHAITLLTAQILAAFGYSSLLWAQQNALDAVRLPLEVALGVLPVALWYDKLRLAQNTH